MNVNSIEAESQAMRRVASALLRDSHAAEDAVQDAWVAALSTGSQRKSLPGRGWLTTVVRRLSWATRSQRRPQSLVGEPSVGPSVGDLDRHRGASRSRASADLAEAMLALPVHYREVLERRYWDGEPPRVIARQLGVDVKTVRNRLHRAQAQLRQGLECGHEDGPRGARLLLIGLVQPDRISPLTALSLMSTTAKIGIPLAAAALFVIAVALRPSPVPIEDSELPQRETSRRAEAPKEVAALAKDEGHARKPAEAEVPKDQASVEPDLGIVRAFGIEALPAGTSSVQLTIDVRDRMTGRALDRFGLALRDERQPGSAYFECSHEDLEELRIPSGSYDMAVRARGFDDEGLGVIEVGNGPVQHLGRVDLSRGSASIRGRVSGTLPFALDRLTATVTAVGRWPCRECSHADGYADASAPWCTICGFDGRDSHVRLNAEAGSFEVDQLVAGPARVVLSARESGGLVASRVVTLERGAETEVVFRIATKEIVIELEDAEGRPFDGAWVEEAEMFRAPLAFHAWSGDIVSATGSVDPGPFGESLGVDGTITTIVAQRRDLTGDDTEPGSRTALAELWPDALPMPRGLQPKPIGVQRIAPGIYRLSDVPSDVSAVQVACGPFAEAAVSLEPGSLFDAADSAERARIVVRSRCGITARQILMTKGVSCTSCHKVQGM